MDHRQIVQVYDCFAVAAFVHLERDALVIALKARRIVLSIVISLMHGIDVTSSRRFDIEKL